MQDILTVPGKDALGEFVRLRAKFDSTGLYPMLLGEADSLETIREGMECCDDDPAEILERAAEIDPLEWFESKKYETIEMMGADEGEWPSEKPEPMEIITHLDVCSMVPHEKVLIGLLSLKAPWEAFAQMKYGNWNDCPLPEEHCAIQKYWADKYGAEVVSITSDIVQCTVARPPTDRETCLALAREQNLYCYDIVSQGVGTVANLAASLQGSKVWYFWWD